MRRTRATIRRKTAAVPSTTTAVRSTIAAVPSTRATRLRSRTSSTPSTPAPTTSTQPPADHGERDKFILDYLKRYYPSAYKNVLQAEKRGSLSVSDVNEKSSKDSDTKSAKSIKADQKTKVRSISFDSSSILWRSSDMPKFGTIDTEDMFKNSKIGKSQTNIYPQLDEMSKKSEKKSYKSSS